MTLAERLRVIQAREGGLVDLLAAANPFAAPPDPTTWFADVIAERRPT